MRQNIYVKYGNRLVHQLSNLIRRSGLVQHLIEQFCRTHQGSKADGLTLNLVHWSLQTLFCMRFYLVFRPYLLCSF